MEKKTDRCRYCGKLNCRIMKESEEKVSAFFENMKLHRLEKAYKKYGNWREMS